MRWPWEREIDKARSEVEAVKESQAETAKQLQDVESTIQESLETVGKLRYHLEKNGWTELLQQAWGGR